MSLFYKGWVKSLFYKGWGFTGVTPVPPSDTKGVTVVGVLINSITTVGILMPEVVNQEAINENVIAVLALGSLTTVETQLGIDIIAESSLVSFITVEGILDGR